MRLAVLVGVFAIGACGDNLEPEGIENPCIPNVPSEMPVPGPFPDPLLVPLPSSCVEGGLRDLPGRWWVNTTGETFSFSYPRFAGTCEDGLRRAPWLAEDANDADGFTYQTWSDGTRLYTRQYSRFEFGNETYEYAEMLSVCMRPNGTLATVTGVFDSDRGQRIQHGTGERFEAKDEVASGISFVGQLPPDGGSGFVDRGYDVAAFGTHVYMVGPDGFNIVDVSDPAHPLRTGHIDGEFNDVEVVQLAGKVVAYLSPINNNGTGIVDVTNGAALFAGYIPAYSHTVQVTTDTTPPRLYLGNYTEKVPVYDITNPLIPVLVASVPIKGSGEQAGIHDIRIDGTRIYANKTIDGMVAVDVASGFATPTELGRIRTSYSHATWTGTPGGHKIAIHGDEGMTVSDGGAFLRVIDADETSPTFMKEIGRYQSRRSVGIHNMIIVGDRAYIAYYQDGVRVLDLSNPREPREIAHYNTYDVDTAPGEPFEGALGLALVGDLLYVADDLRGLLVLRVEI